MQRVLHPNKHRLAGEGVRSRGRLVELIDQLEAAEPVVLRVAGRRERA